MDKFITQDIPEDRRKQVLSDSCDAVEEIGYTRRFSIDELNHKKENLANLSIEINDIEEEKADAMSAFKFRLKPLVEDKTTLLADLKTKSEYVKRECYKFIDHENKMVGYYNELGELVSSRPIMPQEMQKSFFTLTHKTGTEE